MATLKLPKKLPASTVLEVVLAMVIVIVVFGLAMMIFTNVTRSSPALQKTRAAATVSRIMLQQHHRDPAEETIADSDLTIKIHTGEYPPNTQLLDVTVTAFDANQQVLARQQQLLLKP